MKDHSWIKEYPGSIIVCNPEGFILEMNDRAENNLKSEGGNQLIGQNLFDCHSEASRTKLEQMMSTQQTNVYTIEKKGVKKLIYQSPWYQAGKYSGFIELSLEIPFQMPHFIREG